MAREPDRPVSQGGSGDEEDEGAPSPVTMGTAADRTARSAVSGVSVVSARGAPVSARGGGGGGSVAASQGPPSARNPVSARGPQPVSYRGGPPAAAAAAPAAGEDARASARGEAGTAASGGAAAAGGDDDDYESESGRGRRTDRSNVSHTSKSREKTRGDRSHRSHKSGSHSRRQRRSARRDSADSRDNGDGDGRRLPAVNSAGEEDDVDSPRPAAHYPVLEPVAPPVEATPVPAPAVEHIVVEEGVYVPMATARGMPFVVNEALQSFSLPTDAEEVMRLEYTPYNVSEPKDFKDQPRALRGNIVEDPRVIKAFICVTASTEEPELVSRTLESIAQSLPHFRAMGIASCEVLVVLIFDGRAGMHEKTIEYLDSIGMYQERLMQERHIGGRVHMHIFERSVFMTKVKAPEVFNQYPMQMILAIKEDKKSGINSHLWFFTAFCRQVLPQFCYLVDCGNVVEPNALCQLTQCFIDNPCVAGCTGRVVPLNGSYTNIWEAAQVFEMATSYVFDSPMESICGWVEGLSDEFAAYRYEALLGDPLGKYFYAEDQDVDDLGPFDANMHLVGDEVLSMEIIAKKGAKWTLRFVTDAVCYMEVPNDILSVLRERRKHVNGNIFTFVYSVKSIAKLVQWSRHNPARLAVYFGLIAFRLVKATLTWFMFTIFYFSFAAAFTLTLNDREWQLLFNLVYMIMTVIHIVYGLGTSEDGAEKLYKGTVGVFAGLVTGLFSVLAYQGSVGNLTLETMIIIGAVPAMYIIGTLIHGKALLVMLLSTIQYMLMMPFLLSVITIYSFCNMHDITTWSKDGSAVSKRRKKRAPVEEDGAAEGDDGGEAQVSHRSQGPSVYYTSRTTMKLTTGPKGNIAIDSVQAMVEKGYGQVEIVEAIDNLQREWEEERNKEILTSERRAKVTKSKVIFAAFRNRVFVMWLFTNMSVIVLVYMTDGRRRFSEWIVFLGGVYTGLRFLGGLLYQADRVWQGIIRVLYKIFCRCRCACAMKKREWANAGTHKSAQKKKMEEPKPVASGPDPSDAVVSIPSGAPAAIALADGQQRRASNVAGGADGVDEKQRLPALGAGAQRRRSSVFVTGADGILLNTKERRKSLSFVVQNEAAAVALAAAAAAAAAAPAAAPAARGDVDRKEAADGARTTGVDVFYDSTALPATTRTGARASALMSARSGASAAGDDRSPRSTPRVRTSVSPPGAAPAAAAVTDSVAGADPLMSARRGSESPPAYGASESVSTAAGSAPASPASTQRPPRESQR